MKIQCLYSGEAFKPIRSNQKFASTKNRISYHNAKLKKVRDARASIDNKLHKNYLILLELMKDKTNLEILELLEENNEMTLGGIVKDLGISAERGLQHMLNLKQSGLVRLEKQAKYALNI